MASPISAKTAKGIIKIVNKASKTKDGRNFRAPIADLWPVLADLYQDRISNPIDLGTIHRKLIDSAYPDTDAFQTDVRLIAANAIEFNGPQHIVAIAACALRDKILDQLDDVIPITGAPVKAQGVGKSNAETENAKVGTIVTLLPNETEAKRTKSELDPPDNGLPTSTPQHILPQSIQQIIDVIVQAENHLTTAQSVFQAQLWFDAANKGLNELQKAGYDNAAASAKLSSLIPHEFEIAPQNPTLIQRKREYIMRDVWALREQRRAVETQMNTLKAEELELVVEQKRLKASIDAVEHLLEQQRRQQQEGNTIVASLSDQIHELLNSFGDDESAPQTRKRQFPNDGDEDADAHCVARSKGGDQHI